MSRYETIWGCIHVGKNRFYSTPVDDQFDKSRMWTIWGPVAPDKRAIVKLALKKQARLCPVEFYRAPSDKFRRRRRCDICRRWTYRVLCRYCRVEIYQLQRRRWKIGWRYRDEQNPIFDNVVRAYENPVEEA